MNEGKVTTTPTLSLAIWHMIVSDYERELEDDKSSRAYYERALAEGKTTEVEAKKTLAAINDRICRTERILNALFDE